MRQAQELVRDRELVQQLERRWMDGVAAKVAQEIAMLLENGGADTGPREQQPEHHSAGPPPQMQH